MKNEIVKIASLKGFISRDRLVSVIESYYYLWLCELQRWLRNSCHIDVLVEHQFTGIDNDPVQYQACVTTGINDTDSDEYANHVSSEFFDKYELALESGLLEALKLI